MDQIRASMRGSNRLFLRETDKNQKIEKSPLNLTKGIDSLAEELIISTLKKKLLKKKIGIKAFTVFSEELGIKTFPKGIKETDAELVIFIDPVDGTEFIESLQGGWCLIAVYDRKDDEVICAVAGDIFLNRLYWATRSGEAEAIDFTTHSWFRLDGGPQPKENLAGARVSFLTTKVSRFCSVASQQKLLNAIEKRDGRINLSWGSNMIIQVAAGYADAAIEFTKGFATYDFLPGFFIGLKSGVTILDPNSGQPIDCKLDIDDIFSTYRHNPKEPKRIKFVAANTEKLAKDIVRLLEI
ncbi:MAG: inositol monophosphatase family protein [Sedimentisphaerales bacterium]